MSVKVSHLDMFNELSAWEVKRTARVNIERQFVRFTGKLWVMELHIPYTKYDLVNAVMDEAAEYCGEKIGVLDADSLNLDLFSRFKQRSSDKSKPTAEIKSLIEVLKKMSDVFDKVIYITGNHENRLRRVVLDYVPDKAVAEEILALQRPLKGIFEEEKLDKVVYVDHYFVQVGDVIVCHMENNSTVPGSLSRELVSYFKPRILRPFNAIIQAHTHCQSWIPIDRVLVVECGAMIDSLDYWRDGKMKGKRKMSSYGFAVSEMVKGAMIPNKTRPLMKGWEGYL